MNVTKISAGVIVSKANISTYAILTPPEPNFVMTQGESDSRIRWEFRVKRTLLNRFRYWLFCKFFPFRIVRWASNSRENFE